MPTPSSKRKRRFVRADKPKARGPRRKQRGIQVLRAEKLLGKVDMTFDPALARLEVMQRHGIPFPVRRQKTKTLDEETEEYLAKALAMVR